MSNLTLNVKKKWFDMILSGVKKEEYREIKSSYLLKLGNGITKQSSFYISVCNFGANIIKEMDFKKFKTITFLNGMKPKTPTIIVECKGIEIGKAVPEWSDNWQGEVFIIKLGEIISTKNLSK
jgi:hypothetical protein